MTKGDPMTARDMQKVLDKMLKDREEKLKRIDLLEGEDAAYERMQIRFEINMLRYQIPREFKKKFPNYPNL
jgi:hypothetical protein